MLGAGAADVTATMQSVAHHFGLRQPELDVTFTALSMGYQASPEEPPVLMIRNVKHRDIDYADVTQVDQQVERPKLASSQAPGAQHRFDPYTGKPIDAPQEGTAH